MYIEIVKNRNSPPAVLLRECYREDGKVMKRTIANFSKCPPEQVAALRSVFGGECIVGEPESGPIFGTLAALDQIAESIGLWDALGNSRNANLIKLLIFARVAHQGSRLSAVRWAKNHAVNEILGLSYFDEDDFYSALDWLDREQNRIEDLLFERYIETTKQPLALVLYDVTSSYFEGEFNELAELGYSRDGRSGKRQIVVGLLTAPDGEPLAIEVFKGNTTDPTTVESQVEKLVKRFKVKDIVFVGDRGMVKTKGRAAIRAALFRYITALTDPQVRKLLKKNVLQPGLFDKTIAEVEDGTRRYILRRDDSTRAKEQHRREDKLKKLTQRIATRNATLANSKRSKPETAKRVLEAWSKRHKLTPFVKIVCDDRVLSFVINVDDLKNAALLDGCYVLDTDVSSTALTKEQVDARYRDLQKVEGDFRRLKTVLLEMRPIFVRKATRTRGHVFVSMLSLKVARTAEQRLRKIFGTTDSDPHTDVLNDALESLSRLCLLFHSTAEQRIVFLPRPDAEQQKIQQALGVNIKVPHQATAS